MKRVLPYAFATIYAIVPLFPSFIGLTVVAFPGVSVVPLPLMLAALVTIVLLAVYAVIALAQNWDGAQPLLVPLLVWLGCAALAALAGFDPVRGLVFFGLFTMGIVWHVAVVRFYREPGVATAIFASYLISGTLAFWLAIGMTVLRVPPSLYALAHGRATGTFVLPGELAGYAIVFLPIAACLGVLARGPALRALAWCATASGAVALAMTYSRAGWIGAAVAMAVWSIAVWGRTRGGRRAAYAAVGVAAVAIVVLFNSHHDPSEDYTRIAIWHAAVTIVDRFPLTGVGPFDFPLVYAHVRLPAGDPVAFHAHSLYLTLLAETGALGFAAFLWTTWAFVRELAARCRTARRSDAVLALAIAAGLAGVAVQGLIDTVSIVIFGLWLPTLGLALAAACGPAPLRDLDPNEAAG